MGAVESCCGQRKMQSEPIAPLSPIAAIGNQYVTFQPEQQEVFRMPERLWLSPDAYEVCDMMENPWFKLEGSQWSNQKRIVLNTGEHHATIERKGQFWHIYVGGERRATVRREMGFAAGPGSSPAGQADLRYAVLIHDPPYPSKAADDKAGNTDPRLFVQGDFKAHDYWFIDSDFREHRRVAHVDRTLHTDGRQEAVRHHYFVKIAACVDVALIIAVTVVVDACEAEDAGISGGASVSDGAKSGRFDTGRSDNLNRDSLDSIPLHPAKNADPGKAKFDPRVPQLWGKGRTPRNG